MSSRVYLRHPACSKSLPVTFKVAAR